MFDTLGAALVAALTKYKACAACRRAWVLVSRAALHVCLQGAQAPDSKLHFAHTRTHARARADSRNRQIDPSIAFDEAAVPAPLAFPSRFTDYTSKAAKHACTIEGVLTAVSKSNDFDLKGTGHEGGDQHSSIACWRKSGAACQGRRAGRHHRPHGPRGPELMIRFCKASRCTRSSWCICGAERGGARSAQHDQRAASRRARRRCNPLARAAAHLDVNHDRPRARRRGP